MSNDDLFRMVNDFARQTPWLHGPMTACASYGAVPFALLLVVGWWTARWHGPAVMAAAVWAPAGVLLAVAADRPISLALDRPGPVTRLPHVLILMPDTPGVTGPSHHAAMAGAAAAGLFLVRRRLGVLAAGLAALMGLSLVYVGTHYPSEVLGGLLLGGIVSSIGLVLAKVPLVAVVKRLRSGPLRPLMAA
jgi:membrane-associated phospholipid phosphatase